MKKKLISIFHFIQGKQWELCFYTRRGGGQHWSSPTFLCLSSLSTVYKVNCSEFYPTIRGRRSEVQTEGRSGTGKEEKCRHATWIFQWFNRGALKSFRGISHAFLWDEKIKHYLQKLLRKKQKQWSVEKQEACPTMTESRISESVTSGKVIKCWWKFVEREEQTFLLYW